MTIVHQSTCLSKGAFHTSTFGVLPAHERLAIATKALRDLAREQRKRAKHAAEVRRLLPIFPAWPVPVAVVESRSRPGAFYTIDLEAQTCDCPARISCAHIEASAALHRDLVRVDAIRAARERSNWRLMQATYGGSIFRYEPDEEGDAAA
jgi:hypothetical protein